MASFAFNISGDVLEFVAAVISRGIAQQTALKALAFSVDGNLSLSSVNALQNSLLENSSLSDLVLTLRGEIPDNWQSVVEKLRSVKKGSVNCTFDPDPGSSVTCNQVALFRPAVVEKGIDIATRLHCSAAIDSCITFLRARKQNSRIVDHMQASGITRVDVRFEVHKLDEDWAFRAVLSPF